MILYDMIFYIFSFFSELCQYQVPYGHIGKLQSIQITARPNLPQQASLGNDRMCFSKTETESNSHLPKFERTRWK